MIKSSKMKRFSSMAIMSEFSRQWNAKATPRIVGITVREAHFSGNVSFTLQQIK